MATITKPTLSLRALLLMVIISSLALVVFPIGAYSGNISDKALIGKAKEALTLESRMLQTQDRRSAVELNRSVAVIRNKIESGNLTPSDLDRFFQKYPRLHANLEKSIGDDVSQSPKCDLIGGPVGRSKCRFICAITFPVCELAGVDCDECKSSSINSFSIAPSR